MGNVILFYKTKKTRLERLGKRVRIEYRCQNGKRSN